LALLFLRTTPLTETGNLVFAIIIFQNQRFPKSTNSNLWDRQKRPAWVVASSSPVRCSLPAHAGGNQYARSITRRSGSLATSPFDEKL
jgi:hypothetical protein